MPKSARHGFNAKALNAHAKDGVGWLAAKQGLRSVARRAEAYRDVFTASLA